MGCLFGGSRWFRAPQLCFLGVEGSSCVPTAGDKGNGGSCGRDEDGEVHRDHQVDTGNGAPRLCLQTRYPAPSFALQLKKLELLNNQPADAAALRCRNLRIACHAATSEQA